MRKLSFYLVCLLLALAFQNCGRSFESANFEMTTNSSEAMPVTKVFTHDTRQIKVVNLSQIPDARAEQLVDKAINDLGFKGAIKGPTKGDSFFVGRYYMAWIDNTGFYGKMNGLWTLNGQDNANADFILKEESGRAVNFLAVAENGDGMFPPEYSGGDHVEVVSYTKDLNSVYNNKDCHLCEGYNHQEAFQYNNKDWWGACDRYRPGYDAIFSPIENSVTSTSWSLNYEGPLVVGADTTPEFTGEACGKHMLFPDQIRRPVYLQAGYNFYADKPYLERVYKIRNESGNPDFGNNIMAVVGGFVFTKYPAAHPLKQLRHIKIEQIGDKGSPPYFVLAKIGMPYNAWGHYDYAPSPSDPDDFILTPNANLILSTKSGLVYGQSVRMSQSSPYQGESGIGINYGNVLQGIEAASGILDGKAIHPLRGGSTTGAGVRRLEFAGSLPYYIQKNYAVKDLSGDIGSLVSTGREAKVGITKQGVLANFKINNTWGANVPGRILIELQAGSQLNSASNLVEIELVDTTRSQVVAKRLVKGSEFQGESSPQNIALDFALISRSGNSLQIKVKWLGEVDVLLKTIELRVASSQKEASSGTTCIAGQYLLSSRCVDVGTGYYSPNGENNRYACSNKPENSQSVAYAAATGVGSNNCPYQSVICLSGYSEKNKTCVQSTSSGGGSVESPTPTPSTPAPAPIPVDADIIYEATSAALKHAIGRAKDGGWTVNVADDKPNYMSYGPYATNWGSGANTNVIFDLSVDNNTADDSHLLVLEVFDASSSQILKQMNVTRRQFKAAYQVQSFVLPVDLTGRAGHVMEARVLWKGHSYVLLKAITVRKASGAVVPPPPPTPVVPPPAPTPVVSEIIYEATSPNIKHLIGRAKDGGWTVNVADDKANYMSYGPYATDWGGGASVKVTVDLAVDNNSADDSHLLIIDVHDASTGKVLAQMNVTRKQFKAPFQIQSFVLPVDLTGLSGHSMEVRVFWKGNSYVLLKRIKVAK